MPKVLADAQVQAFERDGCLSPVRAMSAERARYYREKTDACRSSAVLPKRRQRSGTMNDTKDAIG